MGHPVRDHACLSSIDWGFLWQGHQEVMARLARAGGRVLYVENTGVRRPRLGDWPRLVRRFVSWSRAPSGRPDPMTPGLHVLSPVVLPFPWSPIARAVNRTIFAERLPAMARRRGLTAPVVWTFLPTPLALDVMRAFRSTRSLSVYYCIADFAQLADNPAAATWSEDALLGEVDLVFVDGRLLTDRLSRQHPRVRFAPFGVAEHFFSPPAAEPTELSAIPRPRVGYVGGLHRHVDAGLLRDVVAALPEVSFVFVGPRQSSDLGLDLLPNTHFIGRRDHEALPAYVDAFDICLIPYRLTPYTATVYPTKLHEYLARGKPVVSTALPEVQRLDFERPLVTVVSGASEMVGAIRGMLRPRAPDGANHLEVARAQSWDLLLDRMLVEIEAAIEARAGRAVGPR